MYGANNLSGKLYVIKYKPSGDFILFLSDVRTPILQFCDTWRRIRVDLGNADLRHWKPTTRIVLRKIKP